MTVQKRDWQDLCEAASKEENSEQLRTLISELVKALDERSARATPGPNNEWFDAA